MSASPDPNEASTSVTSLIVDLEKQKAALEKLVTSVQSCINDLKKHNGSVDDDLPALSSEHSNIVGLHSGVSQQEVTGIQDGSESFGALSKDISLAIPSLYDLKTKVDSHLAAWTTTPTKAVPSKWPLTQTEYRRYARQLIMPEVGLAGQLRLKKSSALIIGAGGLGCPAAAYLAGAGIGTIGIMDGDVVEESNLHRQILHDTMKVGMMKVDSIIEAMRRTNPLPTYIAHRTHLMPETALDILGNYDIILDCTDNPATRYLISDACVLLGKPLVSASALRTDGQLSVLNYPPAPPGSTTATTKQSTTGDSPQTIEVPAGGPCYRCIWPTPPPPSAVQTCGEGGILGPVVGAMGVLQALETIKILASPLPTVPVPASMLLFSSYPTLGFRSIRLRTRRANCATCSANATVSEDSLTSGSLDYVAFCGGIQDDIHVLPESQRIDVEEFTGEFTAATRFNQGLDIVSTGQEHAKIDSREHTPHNGPLIVDVREKALFDIFHIQDSINLPFSQLELSRDVSELPEALLAQQSKGDMIVLCQKGNDSQVSVLRLRKLLDRSSEGKDGEGKQEDTEQVSITDVTGGWRAIRRQLGHSAKDWPEF